MLAQWLHGKMSIRQKDYAANMTRWKYNCYTKQRLLKKCLQYDLNFRMSSKKMKSFVISTMSHFMINYSTYCLLTYMTGSGLQSRRVRSHFTRIYRKILESIASSCTLARNPMTQCSIGSQTILCLTFVWKSSCILCIKLPRNLKKLPFTSIHHFCYEKKRKLIMLFIHSIKLPLLP